MRLYMVPIYWIGIINGDSCALVHGKFQNTLVMFPQSMAMDIVTWVLAAQGAALATEYAEVKWRWVFQTKQTCSSLGICVQTFTLIGMVDKPLISCCWWLLVVCGSCWCLLVMLPWHLYRLVPWFAHRVLMMSLNNFEWKATILWGEKIGAKAWGTGPRSWLSES